MTASNTKTTVFSASHPFLWWVAYIAFVVYGSLVPLDFHPQSLAEAWSKFSQVSYFNIGVEGRADWVANGVLYLPVGFMTSALFAGSSRGLARLLGILVAMVFCAALAIGVEFVQVYFPPRTVSLNDIIAEILGSALGSGFAIYWSRWFRESLATLMGHPEQYASRLLHGYALMYIAYSLFPLDLALSASELAAKFHSDMWGWFLAGQESSRGNIILVVKLLAETLTAMPLGMLLASSRQQRGRPVTRNAALLGALLGLTIEVVQFFIYSGISQGISIFTRSAGFYFGTRLWRDRQKLKQLPSSASIRRSSWPVGFLYLATLLTVNGWFDHTWLNSEIAASNLADTQFLPFYYHYFTTEQAALISLTSVALMYAPIGVVIWIRQWAPRVALGIATLIGLVVETGKLFLDGLHADPTNVLIASLAAWGCCRLLYRFSSSTSDMAKGSLNEEDATPSASATANNLPPQVSASALAVSLPLAIALLWLVIDFPFFPAALGVLLLAYACLAWRHPQAIWIAIPGALPLLDLAPWSGRFFVDEFDGLVMISLIIGHLRAPKSHAGKSLDPAANSISTMFGIALAIGVLLGLRHWNTFDANSFTHYYSPFNAIRIAKGALWAALLARLIGRFTRRGFDVRNLFGVGLAVGLAFTVGVVLWERAAFPGLFNFVDIYRVTGPFSQMHTGGADLETYLVGATPFLLLVLMSARTFWTKGLSALLLFGTAYAITVTYSRAGYIGFTIALLLSGAVYARAHRSGDAPRKNLKFVALAISLVFLAAAIPIVSSSFAQARIALVKSDLVARYRHWSDALAIRDRGFVTEIFGMGLGRFPDTHYWRSQESRAGSYSLGTDASEPYLRLSPGSPLYVEQFVSVSPGNTYSVQFKTRNAQAGAAVTVAICEKWLLTSARCESTSLASTEMDGKWHEHSVQLASGELGEGNWFARPSIKFCLSNTSATTIDVANVSLTDSAGNQLLRNGDFSRNLDRWFFTVDQDTPWHIWSLPVALLFDLGWFGLSAMTLLMILALRRSFGSASRGSVSAGAAGASLAALLIIGLFDSLIDSPRVLMLLLMLAALGIERSSARPELGQ